MIDPRLLSVGLWAFLLVSLAPQLSPDGQAYSRRRPMRPYGGRWLLPLVMPYHAQAWRAVTAAATLATALLLGAAGPWWLGLAMTRSTILFPVTTDAVGLLLLVLSWQQGWVWAAIGGAVNEKVPVLAALVTGDPRCLLGLLPWAIGYWTAPKPSGEQPEWLTHPWRAGRQVLDASMSPDYLLLPWGVVAVGLLDLSPWLIAAAYAGCLVARDRARVYQWIGPMAAVAALAWIPPAWAMPLLALHWINPYRRTL